MQEELLNKLRQVTEEERLILQGASQIQSNLYTTQFAKPSDFTIDSKKTAGKRMSDRSSSSYEICTFSTTPA